MIARLGCLLAICLHAVSAISPKNYLREENTDFAVDLYRQIGNANNGKNVIFSPISVSVAFALASVGAKGQTKEQMKTALRLNEFPYDVILQIDFRQLVNALNQETDNYTLNLVDGLFLRDAFRFHEDFLEAATNYFNATLKRLDFVAEPDKSRHQINDWVAEQTAQTIKDLLPTGTVTTDTILVIVNAIYFNALWVHQFDKTLTKPRPFWVSENKNEDIHMMHLESQVLNYYDSQELNCEVLELPYHGDKASMFVLLPHARQGLSNLEANLTGEVLYRTLRKVQQTKIIVQLPKFKFDQFSPLKQFLQTLGMVDAFDPAKADLSGIASGHLVITDAMHQAMIDVTEGGTEAAAATAIVVGTRAAIIPPPPVLLFRADHPFLFLILEKTTQTALFLGRLVRPPTHP